MHDTTHTLGPVWFQISHQLISQKVKKVTYFAKQTRPLRSDDVVAIGFDMALCFWASSWSWTWSERLGARGGGRWRLALHLCVSSRITHHMQGALGKLCPLIS